MFFSAIVLHDVTVVVVGVVVILVADGASNVASGLVITAMTTLAQSGNFSREAKEGNCVAQLEIAGDRRKNGSRGKRERERKRRGISINQTGEREEGMGASYI